MYMYPAILKPAASFKIMKVHKSQHTYCKVANMQGSVHNLPLHPELNNRPKANKDGHIISWETIATYYSHIRGENIFTEGEVQFEFEQNEKARSKFLNALLEAFKANAKIPKRKYREAQAKVNQKIAK